MKQKTNLAATVIGATLCVVFGTMLLINLVIIIKGTINQDKPPSIFGVTPLVVMSGSMSGSEDGHVEVGDLIFVSEVEAEELEIGDVICFMEGTVAVTHRIIEIQNAENGSLQFITKGDANNVADQNPVSAEMLVGKFQTRIPKVGDFAMFLQKPLGMLLFIGIPLCLFILYDILRRQKMSAAESKRTADMEAELQELRKLAKQNESENKSEP